MRVRQTMLHACGCRGGACVRMRLTYTLAWSLTLCLIRRNLLTHCSTADSQYTGSPFGSACKNSEHCLRVMRFAALVLAAPFCYQASSWQHVPCGVCTIDCIHIRSPSKQLCFCIPFPTALKFVWLCRRGVTLPLRYHGYSNASTPRTPCSPISDALAAVP
jgi:hypothetical protein